MIRITFIERVRRQIYNGQPPSDATITIGLVNNLLNDAIAIAAKTNYTDNLKISSIACISNSFYTTYKSLPVIPNEQFLWQIELPEIPVGIGVNEGVETLVFKDASNNQISFSVVWLSENQKSYSGGMRTIPNKTLAYTEGKYVYVMSTALLNLYTAQVTMVSGGDSTDLASTLNVPSDYFPIMMQYLQQQLLLEKAQPLDAANDGIDAAKTT